MGSTAELGEELRQLAGQIDSLIGEFCSKAREFQRRGGHLAEGAPSAVSWLRHNCKMSSTSAADRPLRRQGAGVVATGGPGSGCWRDRLPVDLGALPSARPAR